MGEDMRKQYLLWGLLGIGCLLGIFGQGISYFLWELFDYSRPITYLTIITGVSNILLLFAIGMSLWKKLDLLLAVALIVGGMASVWSFFVLAMWWG